MLEASTYKRKDKLGVVVFTPVIKCLENGKTVWSDYLPVDYVYKEDALKSAEYEIEHLKALSRF